MSMFPKSCAIFDISRDNTVPSDRINALTAGGQASKRLTRIGERRKHWKSLIGPVAHLELTLLFLPINI